MGIISNFVASGDTAGYPKPTSISVSQPMIGNTLEVIRSGRSIAIQLINYISGTPTLDTKIQESSDATNWFDIGGATFPQVTTTDTIAMIIFDSTGRHLRFVHTLGGSSPLYIVAGFVAQNDYCQSFYDNTLLGMSLVPLFPTSSQNGAAIDFNGKSDTCIAVHLVGATSGSGGTFDAKIQESDDGATSWTDIGGATFLQFVSGDSDLQEIITFNRTKRYLRYVLTMGGSSHSCNITAFIGQAITTGTYVSHERKIRGLNRGLI